MALNFLPHLEVEKLINHLTCFIQNYGLFKWKIRGIKKRSTCVRVIS